MTAVRWIIYYCRPSGKDAVGDRVDVCEGGGWATISEVEWTQQRRVGAEGELLSIFYSFLSHYSHRVSGGLGQDLAAASCSPVHPNFDAVKHDGPPTHSPLNRRKEV